MSYTLLLYTQANKGIILEYSARLASAFPSNRVNAVLQTAKSPEWPRDLPLPPGLVSNLSLPSKRVKYGSLAWAVNRYQLALTNGVKRLVLAKKLKADVVHVQIVAPWVDAALFPLEKQSSRVVSTVHDVVPHMFKLSSRLDALLRSWCYSACDGLIFHSAANIAQYKTVYGSIPSKSTIIPLGLTWHGPVTDRQQGEARRHLGLSNDRAVILMFGELRPNKGLHVLLDAFADVVSRNRDAFLLIAGSVHPTVDLPMLEKRLRALPTGSYRWVREWIPDSEMEFYFQGASVVVLPYIRLGSQSGVLMKAYSYECPVVVTDVGSLGETVRADRSGLVVPPGLSRDLTLALSGILTDYSLQMKFRDNIVEVAQEKYSWRRVADLTMEFYERLLH